MGKDHSHGSERDQRGGESIRKLGGVAIINLVGFAIELTGGLLFGSVALIGDAFHMLFDALAYVLALGAAYVAQRAQPGEYWSYGLDRIEPFTAFLNGILLVPMVGYLVWESYQRYLDPVEIDPMMTAALATGGLLVNFGSVYYLQGGDMNLNEKGAFYHLLGDTGASVAVIVSMFVIEYTDVTVVDPLTAVLIGGIIIWSAVKLLRESGEIFFQRSPVSVDDVEERLTNLEGIVSVDDVHIWQLSSTIRVASVHLTDNVQSLEERERLKKRIDDVLYEEFDVEHATIDVAAATSEYARAPEHS
ncbi:cation diffusion facilitator family transporter [Haloparvum sp. AD34]